MIVVDTGPLVAIANQRDQHHEACMTLLGQYGGPLLVPAPVIVEVCQLLASRRGTQSETLFLTSVAAGELQLVDPGLSDYASAAELVQQYGDLPLGAVDAVA